MSSGSRLAFKKLVELKLVWEKRCGRGDANQIYLARVTPIEDPDYSCAPFITEDESEVRGSRTSDLEVLLTGNPQQHAKNRRICCPRIVKIALQELQNPRSQNRRN